MLYITSASSGVFTGLDLLYFTAVNISPSLPFIYPQRHCLLYCLNPHIKKIISTTPTITSKYITLSREEKKNRRKIPTEVYKPLKSSHY